jgi:DNA-binding NarL/FixJ family response regulator
MHATRVVLVDPQPIFRAGVRSVLEETGRYRVVAQAGTGPQANQLSEAPDFDLMLLNARLPIETGLRVAKLIAERKPAARVVVLSNERDRATLGTVARTGATALLPRDTPSTELVSLLDRVVEGEVFLPEATGHDDVIVSASPRPDAVTDDRWHLLSALEVQVLTGVAQGLSIPEIAVSLRSTEPAIEQHYRSVLHKLEVDDPAQAIRHARRHGWIPAPSPFGAALSPTP